MEEKIKVLFFISSLEGGGAERVMVDILNHIDKSKIESTLVLLYPFENSPYKEYLPEDVKIVVVKRKSDRFFEKIKQFVDFIRTVHKEKPQLILSSLTHNNLMAISAGILFKLKVIVCEHNTPGEVIKTREGKKILWFPVAPLVKTLYKFADRVIAVSDGVSSNLIEEFHVPANKIQIIYNPIDLNRITELSSVLPEHPFWIPRSPDYYLRGQASRGMTGMMNNGVAPSLSFPQFVSVNPVPFFRDHIPIVIAIGRLVRQKGFDILIRAFRLVVVEMDARLIIVGEGSERESLERLVKDIGMDRKVSFAGFQRNPYKFLSKADVFVLSSRYEGLPMIILEAMVCGTPVIATNCRSGPREILEDGRCGLLIPVDDEIALSEGMLKLLKDRELRERFSRLGKERALDFSADKIIKQYERVIYESIS